MDPLSDVLSWVVVLRAGSCVAVHKWHIMPPLEFLLIMPHRRLQQNETRTESRTKLRLKFVRNLWELYI